MKKLDNYTIDFKPIYEQEVTEERKRDLKDQLAKFTTIDEKISFLKNEKINYLQNISAQTLEASGVCYTKFAPGAELFWDRYLQLEIDRLENESKAKKSNDEYSHRVHILANQYKAKMSIEPFRHINDWKKERGEKARQAAYTLSEVSKNYKPPTTEELTDVIEKLKDCPDAQRIAINKREEIQNM